MSIPYVHKEDIHNLTAPREVVPLVMNLIHPTSVLDVGCGTGTWLKAFEENGVTDFLGVDGNYLDRKLLMIPSANFAVQDLNQSFFLGRKFDLVISLEVAEHLDQQYADQFVRSLSSHGDNILFSAAIPGQGGQNHLNEQWPPYWQKKFEENGFYFHDLIRPLIWDNEKVEWWYRQNIFLITRERPRTKTAISIVHPELFRTIHRQQSQYVNSLTQGKQGLRLSSRIFSGAIAYKIKTFFGWS